MNCPYCQSTIPDEALTCAFCTKDLYLFKPLLQKIASLEQAAASKEALAALEQKIDHLEQLLEGQVLSPPTSQPTELVELDLNEDIASSTPGIRLKNWVQRTTSMAVRYLLLPLFLLVLAHYLINMVFNLHVIYLRLFCLALPLPFGLFVMRQSRASMRNWAALSAGMAIAAVFAMSFDTSLIDHTPILPQSMLEVREFVEFAFSIWGSYLTGMLITYFINVQHAAHSRQFSYKVVQLLKKTDLSPADIQKRAEHLQGFFGTIVSLGTSAAAIYSGLKNVIGN